MNSDLIGEFLMEKSFKMFPVEFVSSTCLIGVNLLEAKTAFSKKKALRKRKDFIACKADVQNSDAPGVVVPNRCGSCNPIGDYRWV
jgi:hypothetical protein